MKLRIRDNSVRVRLSQSEVNSLHRDGVVSARIGFPGAREFQYVVESNPAVVSPGVFLSNCILTVRLPELTVHTWATTKQVTIEGEQPLEDGEIVRVLIEKDFACLAPRDGEDDSDMYPHPNADTETR
ncbi:MAG: hypothetical protein OEM25_04150 [Gammaproteobacteria bacterium]|nr:hypothetical protein [Gammaproteobacteria bacterium]